MNETLGAPRWARWRQGAAVNLELAAARRRPPRRPLRAGPRRRHRHGAAIARRRFLPRRASRRRAISLRYLVEKGSVAVDGVSLTVSALDDDGFTVSLIPETLRAHDARRDRARVRREHRGRRARQARRAPAGGTRMSAGRPHDRLSRRSSTRSRTSARARWSSSATTRIARTRATSRSPRSSPRPRRSTSWPRRARGLICLALTPERCDELGLDLMAAKNESAFETAVHGLDRGARGRHDRHLRARPRAHDPGRDRPRDAPGRPRPAGPRVPAEGRAGRRARARRADRGGGRPRAARRPEPGGRDLRGHERRRHDGARARPARVLRAPRL